MMSTAMVKRRHLAVFRFDDVLAKSSSLMVQVRWVSASIRASGDLIDESNAPGNFSKSAFVYPNVVSKEEHDCILEDLKIRMKRRRYEKGHWDAVIINYKETELFEQGSSQIPVSQSTLDVMDRIRSHLSQLHFSSNSPTWLPSHAIQLRADGELRAHVDSVRFSGELVAGLSLGSASIMRLRPDPDQHEDAENSSILDKYVDMLLPPCSLYALTGPSRYLYTHELLPDGAVFNPSGKVVRREERFSVIFRDAKRQTELYDED